MPEPPPDTIYLQWESLNEIWLAVQTDPGDVEYIRADVHRNLIAELVAACKAALADYVILDQALETINEAKCPVPIIRAVIAKAEGTDGTS